MTATATPPRAAPGGAAPDTGTPHPARPATALPLRAAAEVALVCLTLATALSFGRVFDTGTFVGPLVVAVLAAHIAASAARRAGWSLVASAIGAAGLGVIVLTWVLYGFTTNHGLPTATTLHTAGHDLSDAWNAFGVVKAPTPPLRGFVLTCGIALWITAFVSDWAAFRLWVPFETIIPSGTLFLFASMFGTGSRQTLYALIYAVAVIAFLLLHRTARQQSSTAWLAPDVGAGTRSLLKVGAGLGAVALVLAAIAGPLLPGAHSSRLWDWQTHGPGARQTISPLVQIKSRLTDRSGAEVFTVKSDVKSYWRLTALDDFDGEVWSSNGKFGEAGGHLSEAVPSQANHEVAKQTFTVRALSSIWLPAAFEPTGVSGSINARWEPQSSTLIVDTNQTTSDGLVYRVTSAIPRFTKGELEAVPNGAPRTIASRDLALPSDFPQSVRDLALQETGGLKGPYAKALALQNFFRDNFTYSLNAPAGHSDTAIESFLFDTKAGYCEQFAGSYAAMARAIGLPARVAVGFTPGDLGPDGLYHVKGEHAHAWPEVYFEGAGWVPFEPTPGRGAPGAESYTGVVEQQVADNNPNGATTLPGSASSRPTELTEPPSISIPSPGGSTPIESGGGHTHTPSAIDRFVTTWAPRIGILLLALGGLAILGLILLPGVRFLRRSRRRRRAASPADRMHVAWTESVEAVAPVGLSPGQSETRAEFAKRAGQVVAPESYAALASAVDAGSYAAAPPGDGEGDRAFELAHDIRTAARARATIGQRARALVDPRDLLPSFARFRRQRVRTADRDDQERIEPVRASR